MENNEVEAQKEGMGAQIYEIGYLLVPTLSEEDAAKAAESTKGAIASFGGTVLTEGVPELIDLAYQMETTIANKKEKFVEGYFGWIKFELSKDKALELKTALDGNESIIRHLFIKTTRDAGPIGKKSYGRTGAERKKDDKKDDAAGEATEGASEDIDQKIDELVTE